MPYAEPAPGPPSPAEPPFLIRVEHRDVDRRGTFRPQARVSFASALREGGLLGALPPEALKDLLLLLTFTTPNGNCSPALHQLAGAMRVSHGKARHRLERLEDLRFRGQPLLWHGRTESGLEVFSPRPWLAPAQEDEKPEPLDSAPPPLRAAGREAVIAHSRAAYSRPRQEVERQIEEAMGYKRPPESAAVPEAELSGEEREVLGELLSVGLLPEQARSLLEGYDLVGIRRQLAWLPYRRAKNPAGMLLAAVKDDYEAPAALWRQASVSDPEPPPAVLAEEPSAEPAMPGTGGEVALAVPPAGASDFE